MKYENGLVIGKFLPLHRGHMALIEQALANSEKVTVLVCSKGDEPIPGHIRVDWVRETYPDAKVIHITDDELPVNPADHPDFFEIWVDQVNRHGHFDTLFTGSDYEDTFSRMLGVNYVPVDRSVIPISGTVLRKDPMTYWEYLSPIARPYFVKKVRIMGAESTGKSTLAERLAEIYRTEWVPEWARDFLDQRGSGNYWNLEDLQLFVTEQVNTEELRARRANKILFCDTDPLTTYVWSMFAFNKVTPIMRQVANERKYDLTLLMSNDIPWFDDGLRRFSEDATWFFDTIGSELRSRRVPFTIIHGSGDDRTTRAVRAVVQNIDIRVPYDLDVTTPNMV